MEVAQIKIEKIRYHVVCAVHRLRLDLLQVFILTLTQPLTVT